MVEYCWSGCSYIEFGELVVMNIRLVLYIKICLSCRLLLTSIDFLQVRENTGCSWDRATGTDNDLKIYAV